MLTRCCDEVAFKLDGGIAHPLSITHGDKIICREYRRMIATRAEQLRSNQLHHVGIDRIAKCLERPRRHLWQVFQFMKTLQTGTLAGRHIALLPSNDRDLSRRHRNEGGSSSWPLDADTGGPKLNHVVPDVALLSLAIPLKLLKARRKV